MELNTTWLPPRVVPYIGTWIETKSKAILQGKQNSRTLYRYVDWNVTVTVSLQAQSLRRTLYRYVDWNFRDIYITNEVLGRTLYRYVDWNIDMKANVIYKHVVPYIGTWIETMIVKGNVIPT